MSGEVVSNGDPPWIIAPQPYGMESTLFLAGAEHSAASCVHHLMNPPAVDNAAHVVQLALTPIFLLSGVAALLNVFSTRLGRISDQVDRLAEEADKRPRRLALLRLRSRALDIAVLLAALAGALTCAAALTLFVGEIRSGGAGRLLFGLFAGALVCAIAALGSFSFEMVLAGRGVRERADQAEGDHRSP